MEEELLNPGRTVVEPANLGDLLKYEAPNLYSRQQVTLSPGPALQLGTVLGRAPDGALVPVLLHLEVPMTPCAVLMHPVEASDMSREAVAIVRHAIVSRKALVWRDEGSPDAIEDAIQQLEQLGIVVRDSA